MSICISTIYKVLTANSVNTLYHCLTLKSSVKGFAKFSRTNLISSQSFWDLNSCRYLKSNNVQKLIIAGKQIKRNAHDYFSHFTSNFYLSFLYSPFKQRMGCMQNSIDNIEVPGLKFLNHFHDEIWPFVWEVFSSYYADSITQLL